MLAEDDTRIKYVPLPTVATISPYPIYNFFIEGFNRANVENVTLEIAIKT